MSQTNEFKPKDAKMNDAHAEELVFVEYRTDDRRKWLQYTNNEAEFKSLKELHLDKWIPLEQEWLDHEALEFDSRRVEIEHPVLGSLLPQSQVLLILKHTADQSMTIGRLTLPRISKEDPKAALDHEKIQSTDIRKFFS